MNTRNSRAEELFATAVMRMGGFSVQCARDCRQSFNDGGRYLRDIAMPRRMNKQKLQHLLIWHLMIYGVRTL